MKLLGLFLIRCVFTKKNLGGQKFVKTGPERIEAFRNTVQWCVHHAPGHLARNLAMSLTYNERVLLEFLKNITMGSDNGPSSSHMT